jgi:hypothetical protein
MFSKELGSSVPHISPGFANGRLNVCCKWDTEWPFNVSEFKSNTNTKRTYVRFIAILFA